MRRFIPLSSQKLFQARRSLFGAVHILVSGIKVLLRQGLVCLVQLVMQPVHRSQNIAANIESLRLLLASDLLHAGQGRISPGFEVGVTVMRIAHIPGRRSRRR